MIFSFFQSSSNVVTGAAIAATALYVAINKLMADQDKPAEQGMIANFIMDTLLHVDEDLLVLQKEHVDELNLNNRSQY